MRFKPSVTRSAGATARANFNCPGQIVVSGQLEACERAVEAARGAP